MISRNVPVRAAASMTFSMSIAYGSRRSIRRPVGWPMQSTSGCSIAAIMRFVIAFSPTRNDVCTDAMIQSSCSSRSSG